MKKIIILLILILLLIFTFNDKETSQIRVRIIPKDNSLESLEIKEEVKEITINFLKENYNDDFNKYKESISNNLHIFNKKVEKYEAKAEFKYHTFYDKSYNDNSVKNETVLTFLVKINEASGDNWWGVIYPEFLDLNSSETLEYKSFIWEWIKKLIGE